MNTIQNYDVETLKPIGDCGPDELEHATDEGCWLWYGSVEAESEVDAIQIVQDRTGRRARISPDA